jgi:hypothetical protein
VYPADWRLITGKIITTCAGPLPLLAWVNIFLVALANAGWALSKNDHQKQNFPVLEVVHSSQQHSVFHIF